MKIITWWTTKIGKKSHGSTDPTDPAAYWSYVTSLLVEPI